MLLLPSALVLKLTGAVQGRDGGQYWMLMPFASVTKAHLIAARVRFTQVSYLCQHPRHHEGVQQYCLHHELTRSREGRRRRGGRPRGRRR